ncbi:MAG: glycosyltransferase [Marinilabiliales bacterium]|nr:glycosyltransferase [Marinilabiliales bacterium]
MKRDSLQQLTEEIRRNSPTEDYEIISIDDGSTDKSWQIITALAKANPRIKAVRFRRNSGKAAALQTGFSLANRRLCLYPGRGFAG